MLRVRDVISKAIPTSKQSDMQASVAAFNKRKAKAAAAAADAPIDFDKYVDVLGKAEVDAIRKEYESFEYTNFEAQKKEEIAEVQAALNKTVAAIEKQSAELSDAAAAASVELKELERTRTTLETSMDDIKRRFPEMDAELTARLEAEDWDTESKPIDITAMRMEAIEKNWDADTLGPLDEATQKTFLEEIEAVEKANQDAPPQKELSPELQERLDNWHKLVGIEHDAEGFAQFQAENAVTDADRELNDEGDLWREIDMAVEKHQFKRVKGLIKLAKEKKANGDIIVNEAWRAREIKKAELLRDQVKASNPVTDAEIEGKSAEELEAMADAAAAADDYSRAKNLIYASRVKSGDVDPNEKDIRKFSV